MPTDAQRREEATREWLFKTNGQVFGPIPEPQLVELLFQGQIEAGTEVGLEDGSWAPLSRIPASPSTSARLGARRGRRR
jgi:hypothetical protein